MTGTVIGNPDESIFKLFAPFGRAAAATDELEEVEGQKTEENEGE